MSHGKRELLRLDMAPSMNRSVLFLFFIRSSHCHCRHCLFVLLLLCVIFVVLFGYRPLDLGRPTWILTKHARLRVWSISRGCAQTVKTAHSDTAGMHN